MYIKSMRHISLLAVAFIAAGCATIANDQKEKIAVRSDPTGAVVSVDCGNAPIYGGITPAVIIIERTANPCSVTIAKERYVEKTVDLQQTLSRATLGNRVPGVIAGAFLGLVALVIDSSDDDWIATAAEGGYEAGTGAANAIDRKTGAAYKHVPGEIFVKLDPEP
jgi:hypothetical protein